MQSGIGPMQVCCHLCHLFSEIYLLALVADHTVRDKQITLFAMRPKSSNILSSATKPRYLSLFLLSSSSSLTTIQTKRLYRVLDDRLKQQSESNHTVAGTPASTAGGSNGISDGQGPWIVGDRMTIADLACFSWINWAEWASISLDDFPYVFLLFEPIQTHLSLLNIPSSRAVTPVSKVLIQETEK